MRLYIIKSPAAAPLKKIPKIVKPRFPIKIPTIAGRIPRITNGASNAIM